MAKMIRAKGIFQLPAGQNYHTWIKRMNNTQALYADINDSLIEILNGKETNIYSMNWIIKNNAGVTEIKVSATAKSPASTTNADSIIVTIEGVIPGKR